MTCSTSRSLVGAGALALAGLVQGDDGDNTLVGDGDTLTLDDLIRGLGGTDALRGANGEDIVVGSIGNDRFEFDPSNAHEGHDRIADLIINEDSIVLDPADVLAASPDLEIGDGSLDAIFAGLDASEDWTLGANDAGDVVVSHPGGTIVRRENRARRPPPRMIAIHQGTAPRSVQF